MPPNGLKPFLDIHGLKSVIHKIKQSKDYKQVSINILSMLIIQCSNLLIPLITFPYLIRTLGIESYGLMTFTQNIVSYGEQFINYGFVLTAPKDIAQTTDDRREMSRRFFDIFYSRLFFTGISALILIILCVLIPKFKEMQTIIFVGSAMLLAATLQIEWFFQGIQQMKNITLVNLMARFMSLFLLFFLVKTPNDAAFAILSIALSQIIANSFSWFLAFRHHHLEFTPPQYLRIKKQIKDGVNVFLSQYLVRFYSSDINVTILGFVSNNIAVGTYQFAYRIFTIIATIATPVMTALYPYLVKLFNQDYAKFWRQIKQIATVYFFSYLLLAFILFFSADFLVALIGNKPNTEVAFMLRLLSISVVIVPFGPIYTQIFMLHNKSKWLLTVCIIGIILNLIFIIPTYYFFKENALPITNALVTWALFFIQYLFVKRLLNNNKSPQVNY
jgi:polysaccharide transporter, PST family